MSTTTTTEFVDGQKYDGKVKFFNNKEGWGFLTKAGTGDKGPDVFVHHSALVTGDNQYKFLIQGEFVEFVATKVTEGKHQWQAQQVTGIEGDILLCQTRRIQKELDEKRALSSLQYKEKDTESSPSQKESARPRPGKKEVRGGGLHATQSTEWKEVVQHGKAATTKPRQPRQKKVTPVVETIEE